MNNVVRYCRSEDKCTNVGHVANNDRDYIRRIFNGVVQPYRDISRTGSIEHSIHPSWVLQRWICPEGWFPDGRVSPMMTDMRYNDPLEFRVLSVTMRVAFIPRICLLGEVKDPA